MDDGRSRRRQMGQNQGEHCSTPIWRENRDVRSGLWPKPWKAKTKVPCAAIRPTR